VTEQDDTRLLGCRKLLLSVAGCLPSALAPATRSSAIGGLDRELQRLWNIVN
jgi:hypothetical protein